jgi:hypothetical protein
MQALTDNVFLYKPNFELPDLSDSLNQVIEVISLKIYF